MSIAQSVSQRQEFSLHKTQVLWYRMLTESYCKVHLLQITSGIILYTWLPQSLIKAMINLEQALLWPENSHDFFVQSCWQSLLVLGAEHHVAPLCEDRAVSFCLLSGVNGTGTVIGCDSSVPWAEIHTWHSYSIRTVALGWGIAPFLCRQRIPSNCKG